MARFSLLITANPFSQQGQFSALAFARALLEQGHTLHRVFFYADGVLVASRLNAPSSDEINMTKAWADIAIKHDVELSVCVTAAVKRGIVNQQTAEQHALTGENLHPAFEITGLGQLVEAMIESDRLVSFG